jgi:O-antigen ligase
MNLIRTNTDLKHGYLISFFLLGLFPIVPFFIKPFLLFPILLTSLINLIFCDVKNLGWKKIGVSSLIYLIFLVSALYSENTDRAIKLLLRLTPFLILPFSLGMVPQDIYKKCFNRFIRVYCISCCLFCLLIFAYSYSLNSSDLTYIYSYISNEFWGYEDHPIYISLYLGIALILIASKKGTGYLDALMFVLILFALIFLSRKGNIISLIMVLFFVLYFKRTELFRKKTVAYILLSLIVVFGTSYLFNSFFLSRFLEILSFNQIADNSESSTGIRGILWRISLSMSWESPFYGYGLGDVQKYINYRLIEENYKNLVVTTNYNAHNQYLQILLSSGYLGLLSFISILAYFFRQLIRRAGKIPLYIFLYIFLCFMFESILERQNGIIITALFFNLLLFLPEEKKTLIKD